jgi:hypothetical protein
MTEQMKVTNSVPSLSIDSLETNVQELLKLCRELECSSVLYCNDAKIMSSLPLSDFYHIERLVKQLNQLYLDIYSAKDCLGVTTMALATAIRHIKSAE